MFYKCKYFAIHELVPADIYKQFGERAWMFFKQDALISLDTVREFYGVPVTVNNWKQGGNLDERGFRPMWSTTGGKLSQHRFGGGFDCDVKGKTAEEVRQDVLREKDTVFTLITCIEANVNWFHFDCRNIPDRIRVVYP